MVGCIVCGDMLQRIPRKRITAMIINSFDCTASEKPHALSYSHTGCQVSDTSPKYVERKALERMIVESTVRIRDVESVVTNV